MERLNAAIVATRDVYTQLRSDMTAAVAAVYVSLDALKAVDVPMDEKLICARLLCKLRTRIRSAERNLNVVEKVLEDRQLTFLQRLRARFEARGDDTLDDDEA